MFELLFGGMTKFRVISFAILFYLIGALHSAVPANFKDLVVLFGLLTLLRFLFECNTPIKKSKKRN